jgi:hypothetical protein
MQRLRRHVTSERGAVLVHAAIGMIGLVAFSTFAVDYGVMWTARRQAQNAADAAALAGAISMAYVAMDDQALARQAALDMAARNTIWGAVPDVTGADVTFPDPCPPGPFPAGGNCIRVNVFRNQRAGGNPLPMFFGQLSGVAQQGVRATATARVLFGGAATCLLPFAIPDKWIEKYPEVEEWTDNETFDIEIGNPPVALPNPDVYIPPAGSDPGTGLTRESLDADTGDDFGKQMTLRFNDPQITKEKAAAGWYRPIRLGADDNGFNDFLDNIINCSPNVVGGGTELTTENGQMATTKIVDTINQVVNLDSGARWDTTMNGGRGGVAGGCMEAGTCTLSPRIRPIAVYDPADWAERSGEGAGQTPLKITKVIGFFIERPVGEDLLGRVMQYPSDRYIAGIGPEAANFVVTITLVR